MIPLIIELLPILFRLPGQEGSGIHLVMGSIESVSMQPTEFRPHLLGQRLLCRHPEQHDINQLMAFGKSKELLGLR